MFNDATITHPEQLENGRRYHVWYTIPSSKTNSGYARGAFSDVFKEFTADKAGFFLHFYEQAKIDWKHVTGIKPA